MKHYLPLIAGLKYTPTSVLFLKVPSISKYQWHSFSIISSSTVDTNTMSILIKSEGSWTSSLSNLIQTEQKSDADRMKCIPVAVEGPYGPVSMDFLRCTKMFHSFNDSIIGIIDRCYNLDSPL